MSGHLEALRAERARRRAEEDRERLPLSLASFMREAWPILKPEEPFLSNWHQEAVCAHLEAVSAGEILRLQVWLPPNMMKSGLVSVFWQPWEWTLRPWLRYWTASYETRLSGRFSAWSRAVMMSGWYRERWGERFSFTREGEFYFENDRGGTRLATSPTSTGTGEHGHRIVIDDPINARSADATSRVVLEQANEWYDGTVSTRGIGKAHARVLVMQRLHELDLAAHMLEQEEWTVLCLPERFWGHPFAWRPERIHAAVRARLDGRLPQGDPRDEGELLWPDLRDEAASDALARSLTSHRAAGQLQQWPAPREGNLLKRGWWCFYDPRLRGDPAKLPRFSRVVLSVDTPLKDKDSSDNVAIQCWGVKGADRYLLDLDLGKMNYGKCKRRVTEMALWARRLWPSASHQVLIENAGYGVELVTDLKRELTGVQKISPGLEGDKVARAEAASDALESGNCFLPGYGPPWQPAYDEARTPAEVAAFVHSASTFPHAQHDDDVDAWSQAMNWLRAKNVQSMRYGSALRRAVARR